MTVFWLGTLRKLGERSWRSSRAPQRHSTGVDVRGDQRLMLWSAPSLGMGRRRSTIPLADLGGVHFQPRDAVGNALPPALLARPRDGTGSLALDGEQRTWRSALEVMVHLASHVACTQVGIDTGLFFRL